GRALHLQSTGGGATLAIAGSMTLNGPGSILLEGSGGSNNISAQFGGLTGTLPSTLTIGGTGSGTIGNSISVLNNAGTIQAAQAGQTVNVTAGTLNNTGTLR